jgi:Cof subfamily protein (haloacid dehalogenase superfamily)
LSIAESSAFPYRLAAIDLDDTLLSPDKSISPQNEAAVRRLQQQGVMILLASGRRHENMLKYHRILELDTPIVSCQGALAKETRTDEILHRQCMPANLAAEIVADGVSRGVTQVYYRMDATYVSTSDEWTALYNERTSTPLVMVADLRDLKGDEPLKILWVNSAERISQLQKEMAVAMAGALDSVITDSEYLEFTATGVTKSIGIAAVAKRYGTAQGEALAFGDGNNDVSMLKWAGLGICMDHGRDSAKAAANLVAPDGDPATSFARAVEIVMSRL